MAYKPSKSYGKKLSESMTGGDWWDPRKDEREQFRVFPPWDEKGICILKRVLHYGFEDEGRGRAYPCRTENPTWMKESPCFVCFVSEKLSEGDKDERKIAKDIASSSPRFVVKGVDCRTKKPAKWAAPLSFGKYFIALLEDKDIKNVVDPKKGHDIYVEKSGKGRGTKYDYRMRPKATPIPLKKWQAHLENLIKTMEVKSNKQFYELLEDNYGNVVDIEKLWREFKKSQKKGGGKKKTKKDKKSKAKTKSKRRKKK